MIGTHKKRTLGELLGGADKDTIFYVGSKTAFMYIGTAEECMANLDGKANAELKKWENEIRRNDNIIKAIGNGEYEKSLRDKISQEEARKKELKKSRPSTTVDKNVKKLEIRECDEKIKRFEHLISDKDRKGASLIRVTKTLRRNVKDFTPAMDRVVKECRRTIRGENEHPGIIVIINGNEAGEYWFYDECHNPNKKCKLVMKKGK